MRKNEYIKKNLIFLYILFHLCANFIVFYMPSIIDKIFFKVFKVYVFFEILKINIMSHGIKFIECLNHFKGYKNIILIELMKKCSQYKPLF